jgi:hypothetical protein
LILTLRLQTPKTADDENGEGLDIGSVQEIPPLIGRQPGTILHSIAIQFRREIPRGNQFLSLRVSAGRGFLEILGFRRQDVEHLARGIAFGRGLSKIG